MAGERSRWTDVTALARSSAAHTSSGTPLWASSQATRRAAAGRRATPGRTTTTAGARAARTEEAPAGGLFGGTNAHAVYRESVVPYIY